MHGSPHTAKRYHLKRHYGITLEDYARLHRRQGESVQFAAAYLRIAPFLSTTITRLTKYGDCCAYGVILVWVRLETTRPS